MDTVTHLYTGVSYMYVYVSIAHHCLPQRVCLGVHRRPISTHIVHKKAFFLCAYCTFFWTPSSFQLEQTLITYLKLRSFHYVVSTANRQLDEFARLANEQLAIT